MMNEINHEYFMEKAIEQANYAETLGEVPVGAVAVFEGKVIGVGHNHSISTHDPSGHAEVMAIKQACDFLQNYRLPNVDLYVTLEPCCMCAGMLVHARIRRLIFGAADPKAGACGSIMNLVMHEQLNHKIETLSGLMGEQCGSLLSEFFSKRRKQIKIKKAAMKAALDETKHL